MLTPEPTKQINEPIVEELNVSEGQEAITDHDWNDNPLEGDRL